MMATRPTATPSHTLPTIVTPRRGSSPSSASARDPSRPVRPSEAAARAEAAEEARSSRTKAFSTWELLGIYIIVRLPLASLSLFSSVVFFFAVLSSLEHRTSTHAAARATSRREPITDPQNNAFERVYVVHTHNNVLHRHSLACAALIHGTGKESLAFDGFGGSFRLGEGGIFR